MSSNNPNAHGQVCSSQHALMAALKVMPLGNGKDGSSAMRPSTWDGWDLEEAGWFKTRVSWVEGETLHLQTVDGLHQTEFRLWK